MAPKLALSQHEQIRDMIMLKQVSGIVVQEIHVVLHVLELIKES